MIDSKKIVEIAESKLEGTDMFVVGCGSTPSNEIELLIDSDSYVSIDACITLSKAVEAEFDREVEDFELTVASAGVGSDFKMLRQYRNAVGKSVEVLLFSGIKVVAKLVAADEDKISLSYTKRETVETASGKKKKQDVEVEESYAYAEIKYTREYIDFK